MAIVEVFKRGQIIPKRLGMQFVSVHKKARHNVTFGADVEVTNYGHTLEIRALSDGVCIRVARIPKRKRHNGTLQPSPLTVSFIKFIGDTQTSMEIKQSVDYKEC